VVIHITCIPAQDVSFVYGTDENFTFTPGHGNVGVNALYASIPEQSPELQAELVEMVKGQRLKSSQPDQ
jgi:hypothetical protein